MIVAFDNSIFTLLVNPAALPRPNPNTGKPTDHHKQKVDGLIESLSGQQATVLIPAPAFSEALTGAENIAQLAEYVSKHEAFEVAPFNMRAAFELAEATKKAIKDGRKSGSLGEPYQKAKFDRQIVAIAKANGASTLYTDDIQQTEFAEEMGLDVVHSWDLPLAPEHAQREIDFGSDE